MSTFAFAASALSSISSSSNNECLTKKNLSCISHQYFTTSISDAKWLGVNLFNFKTWSNDNLEKIKTYLSQIKTLETCLSRYGRRVPILARGYSDYYERYLKDMKQEIKKIEELDTFTIGALDNEKVRFMVSQQKNDFEKFKRDLDKTEEAFKEIFNRSSLVRFVNSLNSFTNAAQKFGKGQCKVESLKKINIPSFQLGKPYFSDN